MRMFLVGMCDIFLILYLTTLGQVNHYSSNLTVADYNELNESRNKVLTSLESSKEQIVYLEKNIKDLKDEKEQITQLAQSTEAEKASALKLINEYKDKISKAKEIESKVLETINKEKEKTLQLKTTLSKALLDKKEMQDLLSKSKENEQFAILAAEEAQNETKIAIEKESIALKLVNETQKKYEKSVKKESYALKLTEETKLKMREAIEKELYALKLVKETQQKVEESAKKESYALKLVEEAQQKMEEAIEKESKTNELTKKLQHEIEIARENEASALKIAAKAKENETKALEIAKAEKREKMIALIKESNARRSETIALKIAESAEKEAEKTKVEIETITQTSDNAFDQNISDKIIQFTVTIEYRNRLKFINKKVINMQGIPVKINNDYLIFVILDQIGLDSSFDPDQYITYSIVINDTIPVTKLYVKEGDYNIGALAMDYDLKHCTPLGKIAKFSSYMPVLLSIRSKTTLGVMDRIRGMDSNFFIFKRDYLRMISMEELYYNNRGIRGTGDYAEYIIEGDQIVDMGGNYIGLAYKKNTIIRIYELNGWHEIFINKVSAQKLAEQIRNIINS